ncbi:MerR family transcriptional regulator [Lactobacillus sp. Sy-1]|uniref:MerR family transcriptional regulator n=1 Tax=Lactobacillus sp. Sy-1 TaxID=2109645 RepID=UPI001C577568|nr:MerR family transcriptional regulator [Lactobacillus sp. Sy-1]MBW1605203.1 MerR family transcriptional regulator [Lactobacillus sp. Sy-1]
MNISEASNKYGVSADALRYWEQIKLLRYVERDQHGYRVYNERAQNWIKFIKCMRNAGMDINHLVKYVALFNQKDATNENKRDILVEQQQLIINKMNEMETALQYLNYKIDNYNQIIKKYD